MHVFSCLVLLLASTQKIESFSFAVPAVETSRDQIDAPPKRNFTAKSFEQPLDHFAFSPAAKNTFKQRYFVDESSCAKGAATCPMVFFVGHEGPLDAFMTNAYSGYVSLLADQVGAVLVYAEHRYYGDSVPTNTSSSPYAHLSAAQALADFAVLAQALRTRRGGGSPAVSRVLAVGGSYGGMLASYLRQQYPDIFDAAYASSAPVLAFEPSSFSDEYAAGFYKVVDENYDETCREEVSAAFELLLRTAREAKYDLIAETFGLCATPRSVTEATNLIALLQQQFVAYATSNYPFPYGALPAFPAAEACNRFQNSSGSALQKLREAVSLSLKKESCVPITELAEWHKYDPGFIPGAWTYQRCTELVIADSHVLESPRSQLKKGGEHQKKGIKEGKGGKKRKRVLEGGSSSLFLPCSADFQGNCWNLTSLRDYCDRSFQTANATLHAPEWSGVQYGRGFLKGYDMVGNVLFTQGTLDPWNFAGMPNLNPNHSMSTNQPTNVPILWFDGAHHLDLCEPSSVDPPSIVEARRRISHTIFEWLVSKTAHHLYTSLGYAKNKSF